MSVLRVVLIVAAFLCGAATAALAVEGPSLAGPIGGTDIRSGLLAPPGIYVGTVQLYARTMDFLNGHGKVDPTFKDAQLAKVIGGPFFEFVPQAKIFGGRLSFAGVVPVLDAWGHLYTGTSNDRDLGGGDPYVEVSWSRYFGTPRPSQYAGANPIPEGLSVLLGFGVVVPAGEYDPSTALSRTLSPGTNIWDFAPTAAFTYTTKPILAEGTEFSAKVYWNNYLKNPDTNYLTGDLMDIDFAITEHIGRFQVGLTGFYAWQVEDDKIDGVAVPPDGYKAKIFELGGIVAYDMPEYASSLKIKAIASPFARNFPTPWHVVFGWAKKF
jgi:hypothetical protein